MDRRLCVKGSVTVDVQQQTICRCRWAHVLRGGSLRQLPARRLLREQNPEGHQACRPARRATDEIRVRDQSENCETDRPDDSARGARPSDQADQVIFDYRFSDSARAGSGWGDIESEVSADRISDVPPRNPSRTCCTRMFGSHTCRYVPTCGFLTKLT